jgi:hypothetical protein
VLAAAGEQPAAAVAVAQTRRAGPRRRLDDGRRPAAGGDVEEGIAPGTDVVSTHTYVWEPATPDGAPCLRGSLHGSRHFLSSGLWVLGKDAPSSIRMNIVDQQYSVVTIVFTHLAGPAANATFVPAVVSVIAATYDQRKVQRDIALTHEAPAASVTNDEASWVTLVGDTPNGAVTIEHIIR